MRTVSQMFFRLTFVRNVGRQYLFSKTEEHPRHDRDSYNVDPMLIQRRHTNYQGDACYGDAGISTILYFEI